MRMTSLAAALAIAGLATGSAFAQGTQGASPAQPLASQNGAYCLEGAEGTAKNCTFATMAACEASKSGASDKCAPNPASTTGSGAAGASPGAAGSNSQPMTSPAR